MPTQCSIRRANLDDLLVLKGMWETACLPASELEKHLTEFQLAVRPDGVVAGAMGLRIKGSHGLIYGEAFPSARQGDEARPALCDRVLKLASNHGLACLWLRSPAGDFWRKTGFRTATQAELKELPSGFGERSDKWLTLVLRKEPMLAGSLGEEFARLHEEERARADKLRRQALVLKWIAGAIAFGFFAGACWLLFKMLGTASGRISPL